MKILPLMTLEAKLKIGASAPFFMKQLLNRTSVSILSWLCVACATKPDFQVIRVQGEAQGTTFHITALADSSLDLEPSVDSILRAVDQSMNPWLPVSLISRINEGDTSLVIDPLFQEVFEESYRIHKISMGYFDITVGGLADAWGFGPNGPISLDSTRVDSLMKFVGMKHVRIIENKVVLDKEGVRFDFNAIAQGYTVDLLCSFLDSKSIDNYLVEVGGELRGKGHNMEGEIWLIGIDKPNEQRASDPFQAIIQLPNKALATSGNYRKFRIDEETGKKYVHTINPLTGYPTQQSLLSATVVADRAMTADGYATAFMAMGLKKAITTIEADSTLEAMLVYSNKNGEWMVYQSPGFEKLIR